MVIVHSYVKLPEGNKCNLLPGTAKVAANSNADQTGLLRARMPEDACRAQEGCVGIAINKI